MEHRRSWQVTLDGRSHRVEVIYAALFGWMSIEVDGVRRARGWREIQTVLGGATLSCDISGHRIDARVTQPFLEQDYAFALRVDGRVQPGSDPQPRPWGLVRRTLATIAFMAAIAIAVALAVLFVARLV